MPVLSKAGLRIDFTSEGAGPPVVLVHSSVSGNRQWRALSEDLADRHRVLAVNLHGYGETSPWPALEPQTLAAQAGLILAVCDEFDAVQLVGHSLGGSVALMAALLLGSRATGLVLLEPNPFHLLRQSGRSAAWDEIEELRVLVTGRMDAGDWAGAAQPFADYWLGDGAWAAMPERRQAAFIESLPPNRYEWDAVGHETTDVAGYAAVTARTLLVSDPATRRPIREIVELFAAGCPAWSFRSVPEGGHMAPLTRPDLVNPIVRAFLG